MASTTQYSFGDRVVHTGKPEWGVGQVLAAQAATGGGAHQSLKIRFDRAGLKTLSTEFALLRRADDAPALAADAQEEADPFSAAASPLEVLTRLPEETVDPFRSIKGRIEATFALYRFTNAGASLMDWAAAQTGLMDPMVRFNRHELEEFFQRFANTRDAHLRKLLADARREDPEALAYALRHAPPGASETIRRFRSQG